MKTQRLISNPSLIVAVLFILAVSVAPVMAADADSRQMNGFSAGSTGMGSSSSNAGVEKTVSAPGNTRGISAGSPAVGLKAESGADATVRTGEKSPKVPWYKKWWVWAIVAVVVTVAVVATVASCGTATAPMGVITSGVNLLQIV
jgi:hypothetical protein